MAGLWDIVVAEGGDNFITNPSFETGTTGWAAHDGGSLEQIVSLPIFGLYNLKHTPHANTGDGCYCTFSATNAATYTASVYVRGESDIPYQLYFSNAGDTNQSTATEFTGDGSWHRHTNTYTAEATETLEVRITKNNSADTEPFYVDGVMVDNLAYETTYLDGDQPGCWWYGTSHASASARYAGVRTGGRVKNLQDDYYFYVTQVSGTSAPPVTNYYTDYALLRGALHEHTKIHGRLFILNGVLIGTSLSNFHTRRAALYDILRPDETNQEPVLIQYTGGSETIQIAAYYDGGMEGGIMEGFVERLGIRFYAPSPEWTEVVT